MLRSITAASPQQQALALKGLRRYQEAERQPLPPPMPVIGESHGATLRDYGGSGPAVLFVPSLINPPNVLDLSADKSLLRWLSRSGHHVLLLDWGWDVDRRRELSVGGHVVDILVPLARQLSEPPALVGYCLGGTMALAAAGLMPVRAVVTIAAPWNFSGFAPEARGTLAALWGKAAATVEALGALPMEVLQSAFWSLDPARTIAKFERFAAMEEGSAEASDFVTLEDWANDGPPIPGAAARELFESFFRDDLPGSKLWQIQGRTIAPSSFPCPILNVVSTSDRVVPYATALPLGERIDLSSGHVGMIVGGNARETLWEPLSAWLSHLPPS